MPVWILNSAGMNSVKIVKSVDNFSDSVGMKSIFSG